MFDYQAGEKYRITLIMVALAGIMAGAFFTVLLSSSDPEPARRVRQRPAYASDPDITGRANVPGQTSAYANNQQNQAGLADPFTSMNLVQDWLPLVWDLNADTAADSQEKAIQYMTPECAKAYRENTWTPQLAEQISNSGIRSSFSASRVAAGENLPDGSVIITVEGKQVLNIPNKGVKTRPVKLEYLVKNTADGLRIAGISEAGKS